MAPIHDAARRANVETLRRLLAAGESPDALDGGHIGLTPLQNLCDTTELVSERATCAACFELLRDAGANLEARSSPSANTALHYAASSGSFGLLSLLVEAGVNVNVINNDGCTPLHKVANLYAGSTIVDCADLLLKAGADRSVNVEAHGWTPLDLAINRGHRRMWPLFLRAGAEINIMSYNYGPYLSQVQRAGGFKKYEQAHLARITAILETPLLPPELVRKILEFWLHAGYY